MDHIGNLKIIEEKRTYIHIIDIYNINTKGIRNALQSAFILFI